LPYPETISLDDVEVLDHETVRPNHLGLMALRIIEDYYTKHYLDHQQQQQQQQQLPLGLYDRVLVSAHRLNDSNCVLDIVSLLTPQTPYTALPTAVSYFPTNPTNQYIKPDSVSVALKTFVNQNRLNHVISLILHLSEHRIQVLTRQHFQILLDHLERKAVEQKEMRHYDKDMRKRHVFILKDDVPKEVTDEADEANFSHRQHQLGGFDLSANSISSEDPNKTILSVLDFPFFLDTERDFSMRFDCYTRLGNIDELQRLLEDADPEDITADMVLSALDGLRSHVYACQRSKTPFNSKALFSSAKKLRSLKTRNPAKPRGILDQRLLEVCCLLFKHNPAVPAELFEAIPNKNRHHVAVMMNFYSKGFLSNEAYGLFLRVQRQEFGEKVKANQLHTWTELIRSCANMRDWNHAVSNLKKMDGWSRHNVPAVYPTTACYNLALSACQDRAQSIGHFKKEFLGKTEELKGRSLDWFHQQDSDLKEVLLEDDEISVLDVKYRATKTSSFKVAQGNHRNRPGVIAVELFEAMKVGGMWGCAASKTASAPDAASYLLVISTLLHMALLDVPETWSDLRQALKLQKEMTEAFAEVSEKSKNRGGKVSAKDVQFFADYLHSVNLQVVKTLVMLNESELLETFMKENPKELSTKSGGRLLTPTKGPQNAVGRHMRVFGVERYVKFWMLY
jgi:hypothetical protein